MEAIVLWLLLLVAGYVFGQRAERRHYRSIEARERALLALPATNARTPVDPPGPVARAELVHGSVVISVDFFKRIAAGLRGIVGGRVQSYETLVDRARREAVLRLKESCPGAGQVINLRLETATISGGGGRALGSVEVLAYGTALYFDTRE
ncbi:MAG TPA: heavy metal-binding domain-containing protein [Noviherbaspirillum sp.]|nr:heavy metal-binding domain-containing protein [Noviherbaspirillum sp.]